jgi:hypothetical protein
MRWIAIAAIALAAITSAASARTTRAFLDRCSDDAAWCAKEIKDARRAVEQGVQARKKLCLPQGLSDEDLANAVTGWIAEQIPSLNHEPDAESIAAALVALYGCDGPRGLEGL